ncbi:MAG: folate-binding protein YgfZ [Rickettsiales bacterium]|jgi:folate-binding protein YgfZ
MNKTPIILQNRAIISVSGEDQKTFLQGLITNDINKVSENQAIYAFMLSPQGRFLYDFFIIQKDDELLLDCSRERIDEIVKKLSFFKFRSKVEIKKAENFLVEVGLNKEDFVDQNIIFADPRSEEMGYRSFVNDSVNSSDNCDEYNFRRINLKLSDDSDLTFDKSFPLEFGFDNFGAVDYKKGCYVGQETTARMHYKGTIRKKIFLVSIDFKEIEKGTEIRFGEKKVGEVLSSILHKNQLFSLILIKNLDNEGKEIKFSDLKTPSDQIIKIIN